MFGGMRILPIRGWEVRESRLRRHHRDRGHKAKGRADTDSSNDSVIDTDSLSSSTSSYVVDTKTTPIAITTLAFAEKHRPALFNYFFKKRKEYHRELFQSRGNCALEGIHMLDVLRTL